MGGAIYAGSSGYSLCTFQINPHDINNVNIYFINNTAALAGSSVYSTNLYNCKMKTKLKRTSLEEIYNNIFTYCMPKIDNKLQNISTVPSHLVRQCPAGSGAMTLKFCAGKTQQLSLAALDAIGNRVFSTVSIDITHKDPIQPRWLVYFQISCRIGRP